MNSPVYEKPVISKISAGVTDKFGMKSQIQPITHIEDIPVKQLLQEFGSPLYIISERTIRDTYEQATNAFLSRYTNVQFAWSYKTNYLNAVCNIYHQMGSWAEVVSGFEYDKAIKNGVPGDKILFNGPDKSTEDITKSIHNQSLLHIDHLDEYYEIVSVASKLKKKAKVAIRINMDTGIYPKWVRFGFNLENGEAWSVINKIMQNEQLEMVGLHTHIGTYILSPQAYGIAAAKLAQLMVRIIRKYNIYIQYIDLGGGFASKNTLKGAYLPGTDTCPSFDNYAENITDALHQSDIPFDKMPALFLESGRALIDDAGFLLSSVIANKRLPDGRRSMIIDAGVNLLFTSFWYEHQIVPAIHTQPDTEDTTIYGPLCMNIDVIRQAVNFPVLEKGDPVVINRIGAYNMTQWMQFINYRPKIVLIDTEGHTHIIRENETLETFNEIERIPDYLKNFRL